jgi:hypothetical protein
MNKRNYRKKRHNTAVLVVPPAPRAGPIHFEAMAGAGEAEVQRLHILCKRLEPDKEGERSRCGGRRHGAGWLHGNT